MAFYGQITGNLGRDPELKYLDNGRVVANFTVAVRQGKRQGQELPPRWVKVAVWGKPAEYVGNYVKKGDKVVLFGRVEPPEQFTRRDGSQGLAEVFTADNIEKFNDAPGAGAAAAAAPAAAPAPAPHPAHAAAGWQPDPSRGTVAAGQQALTPPPVWNSAPASAPTDHDDIPF